MTEQEKVKAFAEKNAGKRVTFARGSIDRIGIVAGYSDDSLILISPIYCKGNWTFDEIIEFDTLLIDVGDNEFLTYASLDFVKLLED